MHRDEQINKLLLSGCFPEEVGRKISYFHVVYFSLPGLHIFSLQPSVVN